MTSVLSYTDFQPLEEIVLGRAAGFSIPAPDRSVRHFFELAPGEGWDDVPAERLAGAIEEADEDLQGLAALLASHGVTVRRPDDLPSGSPVELPGWRSSVAHALMPRDCLLVIGSTIIEAPMPVRARYCETFPYRSLLREWFAGGASWVAAPRPQLPNDTYLFPRELGGESDAGLVLAEREPLFDAANVIRCGRDVFFNVSNTGNRFGAAWLARVLGPEFRVHPTSIGADHVGTTLHVLRPGLLLANAERLTPETLPGPFRNWKVVWFSEPADDGFALSWPRASTWIGMNILSLDEETVVVPDNQTDLIRLLEKEGLTVAPVRFRHGRTFGGGFHCCSLDVRRRGGLESYLPEKRDQR